MPATLLAYMNVHAKDHAISRPYYQMYQVLDRLEPCNQSAGRFLPVSRREQPPVQTVLHLENDVVRYGRLYDQSFPLQMEDFQHLRPERLHSSLPGNANIHVLFLAYAVSNRLL